MRFGRRQLAEVFIAAPAGVRFVFSVEPHVWFDTVFPFKRRFTHGATERSFFCVRPHVLRQRAFPKKSCRADGAAERSLTFVKPHVTS